MSIKIGSAHNDLYINTDQHKHSLPFVHQIVSFYSRGCIQTIIELVKGRQNLQNIILANRYDAMTKIQQLGCSVHPNCSIYGQWSESTSSLVQSVGIFDLYISKMSLRGGHDTD